MFISKNNYPNHTVHELGQLKKIPCIIAHYLSNLWCKCKDVGKNEVLKFRISCYYKNQHCGRLLNMYMHKESRVSRKSMLFLTEKRCKRCKKKHNEYCNKPISHNTIILLTLMRIMHVDNQIKVLLVIYFVSVVHTN